MKSAEKLVSLTRMVNLIEAMMFFRYTAISDDKTCPQCNRYDGSLMTRVEMRSVFPYLEKISNYLYYPHVHPNCRCWLEKVDVNIGFAEFWERIQQGG